MARFLYSAFSDEAADSIDGQIAACKANGVTHMELRGVDGNRIITDGLGSSNPIASNATAAGREQNRRVEIVLINQQ